MLAGMATTVRTIDGPRIRAARLANRMTQKALADAIGARERDVQRWESGAHRPSAKYLIPLLDVLPQLRGAQVMGRSLARPFLARLLPWLTRPRPVAA